MAKYRKVNPKTITITEQDMEDIFTRSAERMKIYVKDRRDIDFLGETMEGLIDVGEETKRK